MESKTKKMLSEVSPIWHHFGGNANDENQEMKLKEELMFWGTLLEGRV